MFSTPDLGIKHFGHFVEEAAGRYGRRDALAVLADALQRCVDEDMRTQEFLPRSIIWPPAPAAIGRFSNSGVLSIAEPRNARWAERERFLQCNPAGFQYLALPPTRRTGGQGDFDELAAALSRANSEAIETLSPIREVVRRAPPEQVRRFRSH